MKNLRQNPLSLLMQKLRMISLSRGKKTRNDLSMSNEAHLGVSIPPGKEMKSGEMSNMEDEISCLQKVVAELKQEIIEEKKLNKAYRTETSREFKMLNMAITFIAEVVMEMAITANEGGGETDVGAAIRDERMRMQMEDMVQMGIRTELENMLGNMLTDVGMDDIDPLFRRFPDRRR